MGMRVAGQLLQCQVALHFIVAQQVADAQPQAALAQPLSCRP